MRCRTGAALHDALVGPARRWWWARRRQGLEGFCAVFLKKSAPGVVCFENSRDMEEEGACHAGPAHRFVHPSIVFSFQAPSFAHHGISLSAPALSLRLAPLRRPFPWPVAALACAGLAATCGRRRLRLPSTPRPPQHPHAATRFRRARWGRAQPLRGAIRVCCCPSPRNRSRACAAGLQGSHTAQAGLAALLQGTGLEARGSRKAAMCCASARADARAPDVAPRAVSLAEVRVAARRAGDGTTEGTGSYTAA